MRHCISPLVVALILVFVAFVGSTQGQQSDDTASVARDSAAQARSIAAEARKRAQVWEEMARKARARAASSSGTMKKIWEENVAKDEAEAKKLNAEAESWEQKARESDQKAAQATNPPAKESPKLNLPLGEPPPVREGLAPPSVPPSIAGGIQSGSGGTGSTPASATPTTQPKESPKLNLPLGETQPANPSPSAMSPGIGTGLNPPSPENSPVAGQSIGGGTSSPGGQTEADADANTPSPSADNSACGCKPLPSWSKGKAPESGSARGELTNSVLESYFSNRAGLYDGDWHKALLALAHDIDPTSELGISSSPAPKPSNPDFHVREGLITDEFIKGIPPPGQRRYNSESGRSFASRLVHTIARTRRYGEPSSGLREHCLLLGHFIGEDLFKVPLAFQTSSHPAALASAAFAGEFRNAIMTYASYGSPQQRAGWGNHKPIEFQYPNEKVALDEFDIADAALDIIFFHDDTTGKDSGWITWHDDEGELAGALLRMASGRPDFQPAGAKVDPRQASVACKAFNTLLNLALPNRKESDKLHAGIVEQLLLSVHGPKDLVPNVNPVALAARAVLASDGPGSADEARATAERLFQWGSNCFQACDYEPWKPWRVKEGTIPIDLLVSLSQPSANNPHASTLSDYIKSQTDQLKTSLKYGKDPCKEQLLARLTAAPTLAVATPSKTCSPPPCDFTVDSMPDEPINLKLESHPGIMVVPKRDYPWTADTLDRSQPFFVEVRLSYDDAAAQGKSLPVKFEVPATGRSKEIILNGAPHHGPTVYSTDAPILFERPFDIAGPSDLVKSPFTSENLASLKLKNGDLVKVSYKDASTTFRFFNSWVQQQMAKNEEGFTDLLAAYEQRLATSQDSGEIQAIQKRVTMIANARKVINGYHPAASEDQLTDLQRCFIGNAYHDFFRNGPRDVHAELAWRIGPSYSNRFGIQLVSAGEDGLIYQGINEGRERLREDFLKSIPIGFSLAAYHIVTQLSGGNQMWTVVYGTDEDGNPVDLTGRVIAGVGFASGALFSVASSKYLTDLSPSAKARGKPGRTNDLIDDEPVEADYKINPDTPDSIREYIEGVRTGSKMREPDITSAREEYGPNAVFRTPDPVQPAVLQISNRNCLIEVARAHILKGTGRAVPEVALREAAAIEGHTRPGAGMSRDGYISLINKAGGKAAKLDGGLKALKQLIDAEYFVEVRLHPKHGGNHAVDFRGFTKRAGRDYAVFADPYFGKEIMLPICDFRELFVEDFKLGWGRVLIADFGQAKPLK